MLPGMKLLQTATKTGPFQDDETFWAQTFFNSIFQTLEYLTK